MFSGAVAPVITATASLIEIVFGFRTALAQFIEAKLEQWLDLKQKGTSLDFLGYTFRYDRDRQGRPHRYLNVIPLEEGLEEGTGRAARDDEQPVLF